jgi:hypothetical protein
MRKSYATHLISILLLVGGSQSFSPIPKVQNTRESVFAALSPNGHTIAPSTNLTFLNAPDWHIWKAADTLKTNGIASKKDSSIAITIIIEKIIPILYQWGEQFAGKAEWQGLLNKSSLLHEIEESIVTLSFLWEYLETRKGATDFQGITLIDVCCGKGVFSIVSSYLFQNDDRIKQIIMLDKADIKWNHIDEVNQSAKNENRSCIDCWSNCNLHEIDDIVNRLEALETPVALVGIHLCKTLSPTCIGIVNSLGGKTCPFFVLAPCCLPSAVTQSSNRQTIGKSSIIKVRSYESTDERRRRLEAKSKRDAAMSRRPKMMSEQLTMVDGSKQSIPMQTAPITPCWKCGGSGHKKADCPSLQTTGKPRLVQPPSVDVDVSGILHSDNPFNLYCELLSASMEHKSVKVFDTGLVNEKNRHQQGNWNSCRKAIYIVAES